MAMREVQEKLYLPEDVVEQRLHEMMVEKETRCGFEIDDDGERVFVCNCGDCGDVFGDT